MRAVPGVTLALAVLLAAAAMGSALPRSKVMEEGNTVTVTPNLEGSDSFEVVRQAVQQKRHLDEKTSWPELVGVDCQVAQRTLAGANGRVIQIVPANSLVTMDFREDRVRIFCDQNGKVARTPRVG